MVSKHPRHLRERSREGARPESLDGGDFERPRYSEFD
jgi:hypothetical protein